MTEFVVLFNFHYIQNQSSLSDHFTVFLSEIKVIKKYREIDRKKINYRYFFAVFHGIGFSY